MLAALVPTIGGIVASASSGIAVEELVKHLTPVDIKAVPAFSIKIGAAIVGGLIAAKVGSIVVENLTSVVETVTNKTDEADDVEPEIVQED